MALARISTLLLANLRRAVATRWFWCVRPHTAWVLIVGFCLIFTGSGTAQQSHVVRAQGLPLQNGDIAGLTQNTNISSDTTSNTGARTDGVLTDAWIYPDAPGALDTLRNGRQLYAVKAEFLHVNDDGSLQEIDQSDDDPNGYSPANVELMKAHSVEQYVTVSGDMTGTQIAMQNQQQTIDTMVALANKTGFGIELDWEEFGQWTPSYYSSFKDFLRNLGSKLHDNGHKLMIDGPPIYDANSQGWYQWRYEELAPLVDNIVMMVYDNEYDTGVGSSIAPRSWTAKCLTLLKAQASDKGIAGVASYGYSGDESNGRISVNDSENVIRRVTAALGSLLATRNSDGELTTKIGDTFYDYSDRTTMDTRLQEVQQAGISHLSVWSLGDNPWF